MRAAIAVVLCSAVAQAAPPTAHLVHESSPAKEGDPDALFGRVAFVDNEHFIELGDTVNDCRAEAMRVGAVSSPSATRAIVTFHSCKVMLGDGIVVELEQTLRRWSLDGKELPAFELPKEGHIMRLVAVDRTTVVVGGTLGGQSVLTAFGEGKPPRVIATLPVIQDNAAALLDAATGVLWIAGFRPPTIERRELATSAVHAFKAPGPNGCGKLIVIPNGIECVAYDVEWRWPRTVVTQYDRDGKVRWTTELQSRLSPVTTTPDGKRTIVADDGKFTQLSSDGSVSATFAATPRMPYSDVALSPDGRWLLAETGLGGVELWSLPP